MIQKIKNSTLFDNIPHDKQKDINKYKIEVEAFIKDYKIEFLTELDKEIISKATWNIEKSEDLNVNNELTKHQSVVESLRIPTDHSRMNLQYED